MNNEDAVKTAVTGTLLAAQSELTQGLDRILARLRPLGLPLTEMQLRRLVGGTYFGMVESYIARAELGPTRPPDHEYFDLARQYVAKAAAELDQVLRRNHG